MVVKAYLEHLLSGFYRGRSYVLNTKNRVERAG